MIRLLLLLKKLNSIETLVYPTLVDNEIIHQEFITILNEKDEHQRMEENVRTVKQKQENMRLNSANSRS